MAHTKADFTLPDAIAGGRLVYSKLTGGTAPNDALFYGALDVLGYGGTFIPAGSTPATSKAVKPLGQAAAKKKLIAALKPLAESEGNAATAGAFDWSKIAALLLQILPFILPLL